MPNEFKIDDLRRALSPCTHLIYRYVGMNSENEQAVLIYPNIDTGAGNFLDRLITHVRRNFPDLKVYLGIGGKNLPFEKTDEYIHFVSFSEVSQLCTIVNYSPVRNINHLFYFILLIYVSYLINDSNKMAHGR